MITRVSSFPFPPLSTPSARTVITRPRAHAAAWTVPAWLPAWVEGPVTFTAGALGGALLGVVAVMISSLFIAEAPCPNAAEDVAARVVGANARMFVVSKPMTAPGRAVAAVAVPRERATPRTTATRRAQPKRESNILAVALSP